MKKRILSCMQPTSHLHLGNYLGALKNWVKLQNEPDSECLYGVVDLHAITQPYEPGALAQATREIAAAYIAGGIDPAKSTLFVQSAVPGHSQLMWMLSTLTQMGKLERMTQFKDKAGKNAERAGLGLFAYPVLMAADILLYKATHVPVGEDQKQHLELAREIAGTFNHRFGEEFFPLPEPYITGAATRVMSLRDGTQKMSKSAESDMSRINLTDDADVIAKKIKKAKTDADPLPGTMKALEGRPEAKNLVTIYAALSEKNEDTVLQEFEGKGFGDFKPALIDLAIAKVAPVTARMTKLMADPAHIDKILAAGNVKANIIAQDVLEDVQRMMGFWRKG
ncbi:MAG: tryptophan--tRNA ligase [Alphaproteobacteria bacterium]|nr:tryptophan--tRNA ligase [Alphaproteobacteria bacterium]